MKKMEFSLYNVKPKLRDDCLLKPGRQDIPFMKLTILQDEPPGVIKGVVTLYQMAF